MRTAAGPILGYQWFDSRALNLRTAAGVLYVDEQFENPPDDDYAALGWSTEFDKYVLRDWIQFYHRQIGIWNQEDRGDLVWDSWTGFRVPTFMGLVTSTEMQLEYDSGAAKDAEELDTTFRLKLGYAW